MEKGSKVAVIGTVGVVLKAVPENMVQVLFSDGSTAWLKESEVTYSEVEGLVETPA
jgi:hypothetical protein